MEAHEKLPISPYPQYPFVFTLEKSRQSVWFRPRTAQDDFSLARFYQFTSAVEPDNYVRHAFAHLHFYLQDSVHDISVLNQATIWEVLYLLCLIYLVSINHELVYEEQVTNEQLKEEGLLEFVETSKKKNSFSGPSIISKTKIQIYEICSILVYLQSNEAKIKDLFYEKKNSIIDFSWPSYERLTYEIVQDKISPVHIQNKKILFVNCPHIKYTSAPSPFFYIPLSFLIKYNSLDKNADWVKDINLINQSFQSFFQDFFSVELQKRLEWQDIIKKGFNVDYTKNSFYTILVNWYLNLFLNSESNLLEEQYMFLQHNWTIDQFLQSTAKNRLQWTYLVQKYNSQPHSKKEQQLLKDLFSMSK